MKSYIIHTKLEIIVRKIAVHIKVIGYQDLYREIHQAKIGVHIEVEIEQIHHHLNGLIDNKALYSLQLI